jgi:hypothetical protein
MPANRIDAFCSILIAAGLGFLVGYAFLSSLPY